MNAICWKSIVGVKIEHLPGMSERFGERSREIERSKRENKVFLRTGLLLTS